MRKKNVFSVSVNFWPVGLSLSLSLSLSYMLSFLVHVLPLPVICTR